MVVIGNGLGRGAVAGQIVGQILPRLKGPVIVDADGLYHLTVLKPRLEELGYWVVLTPNHHELPHLEGLLAPHPPNAILVQKGERDVITGAGRTLVVEDEGTPKRAGGIGDVLCGVLAARLVQGLRLEGVAQACSAVRGASRLAYLDEGVAMTASSVLGKLGAALAKL